MADQDRKLQDFSDLFVDRNLLSVFRASPTIFATRFNAVTATASFTLLTAFCVARAQSRSVSHPDFTATFSAWATLGWTLSSTLLGFLIAGFALLCTVLRPSAVIALHDYHEDGDKNNALRNLFIFFVDIFITFLALLLFSLAMVFVTSPGGPILELRKILLDLGPRTPEIAGYILYVCWGTWFIASALKLKSFIYNLYQSLMIGMTESVHSATECANIVSDKQKVQLAPSQSPLPRDHTDG